MVYKSAGFFPPPNVLWPNVRGIPVNTLSYSLPILEFFFETLDAR